MFIKLTLQNSGHEVFVNFDKAENFYQAGKDQNVWTVVLMDNGRVYDCCETPDDIYAQLAGGSRE